MLSGAAYVGSIPLSADRVGELFVRDDAAILFIPANASRDETLHLGDRVQFATINGNVVAPEIDADGTVRLPAWDLPYFALNVDALATRWQAGFTIEKAYLPSTPNVSQEINLVASNPTREILQGWIETTGPAGWRIDQRRIAFELAPYEILRLPLVIRLGSDAMLGENELTFRIFLRGDEAREFRLSRRITVGDPDLSMQAVVRWGKHDTLLVEQLLSNDSDEPVNFNFQLYAPGRRRLRSSVRGLRRDSDLFMYELPAANELQGAELWLRGEEVRGDRIVNFRLSVPERKSAN